MFARLVCSAFAVAALISASNRAQAGVLIDTITGWNGSDNIFYFGEPDTATYGQTVTVPVDNVLDSFTFLLRVDQPNPVNFQAYVMAWDDANSRASGPVLFSSSPIAASPSAGFVPYTVLTGGLSLVTGDDYVLFFNASNSFDSAFDQSSFASRASADVYAGGLFVFLNNGPNFGAVTVDTWTRNWQGPGYDLAFEAAFSQGNVIPEPSSLVLFGIGAVGFGWLARRRRVA